MANRNGSAACSRCHVVLVPGFGAFDALGQIKYYARITPIFQQWAADTHDCTLVLHYFDNLPTAAVRTRAERLRNYLAKRIARREMMNRDTIVLVGHSTGGLDIRQLICDLEKPGTSEIKVDVDFRLPAEELLERIRGVVFLSVPHWGTNIAEWVYEHAVLRKSVIDNLRAASFAGSHSFLVDRLEAAFVDNAAGITGAEILLAVRDALAEANDDWSRNLTEVANAMEAASELQLYFDMMGRDFHVINDLRPFNVNAAPTSPAHFDPQARAEELALWKSREIDALSYVTVGGRAFEFKPGCKAPALNLINPKQDLEVLRGCVQSARTDIGYRFCYRACAGGPLCQPDHSKDVNFRLGTVPRDRIEIWDNDGVTNTLSMLWPHGERVLVQADHLDVIGHYELFPNRPSRLPIGDAPPRMHEAYDTLVSWPRFQGDTFKNLWSEIFSFAVDHRSFPVHSKPLKPAVKTATTSC